MWVVGKNGLAVDVPDAVATGLAGAGYVELGAPGGAKSQPVRAKPGKSKE